MLIFPREDDRVHYMERLLKHHLPQLSLDVSSLRTAVEDVQSQRHRGSFGSVDVEDLEDLTIDDEDFMIKPMPDNTTRMLSFCCGCEEADMLRILRGILVSQLFLEDSEED